MTIILGKCYECGAEYKKKNIDNKDYQEQIEYKEYLIGKILVCPSCQMKKQKVIPFPKQKLKNA